MKSENRSGLIRFRVKESEKQLFENIARRKNMALSDFIRRSLTAQININTQDV